MMRHSHQIFEQGLRSSSRYDLGTKRLDAYKRNSTNTSSLLTGIAENRGYRNSSNLGPSQKFSRAMLSSDSVPLTGVQEDRAQSNYMKDKMR